GGVGGRAARGACHGRRAYHPAPGIAAGSPGYGKRVMNEVRMTRAEHDRMRRELEALRDEHRETAAERLATTTDLGGDAAENTEVLEARRELEMQEQRIDQLTQRLDQAEIVEADAARGVAEIGERVKIAEE